MNLPGGLPASDDITIISGYTDVVASGTDYAVTTYYHVPVFFVLFLTLIILTIFSRIILEIIIRLRK
jgi:hypothetical protein